MAMPTTALARVRAACLVASLLGRPALCIAGSPAEAGAGDASALLQASAGVLLREGQLLAHWAAGRSQGPPPRIYDCDATPALCSAPFHCDKPGAGRPAAGEPIAIGRHANWRAVCGLPYETAMVQCAAGNLSGYADLMQRTQLKAGIMGRAVVDVDAQYCFLVGHCDNRRTNATTTLAEGEAMCNERYGRRWNGPPWHRFSMLDVVKGVALSPLSGGMNMGFSVKSPLHVNLNDKLAHTFAKLACAMGNYHCDAVYCKEKYCSDPYYRSKYALKRLAPTLDVPW